MLKIRLLLAVFFMGLVLLSGSCKKPKVQPGTGNISGTLTLNVEWGTCNELISGFSSAAVKVYVDKVINNDPTNPQLENFRMYNFSMDNGSIQEDFTIEKPASGSYMITVDIVANSCLICVNNCSGNPQGRGKPQFRTIRTYINTGNNTGGFVEILTATRITAPVCNC